jgi:hypothetical protein
MAFSGATALLHILAAVGFGLHVLATAFAIMVVATVTASREHERGYQK